MNLLVTGGAGFIGSAFVGYAVEQGHNVTVLDLLTYAGHRENLEWISQDKGKVELVVGNICDGSLALNLMRDKKIDAVVNFAAESHVDNSINNPAEFIETNIIGVYRMLEAAREYWNGLNGALKSDFRFIQVSTDEVYGSLGEEGYFTETSRMKPNSPYSASKASGDFLARAWFKTYNLPTIITNCSNNYGPRQFPEKLIPHMITRALNEKTLPVYGDGQNIRDWIHVEDHAHGVYLALSKGKPGDTYCFGGRAEKRNLDLVGQICSILDDLKPRADKRSYREFIAFVPDRPGHDRRYAIDDSKAERELGFTRKHTFETGLRATIEWYLANGVWCDSVTKKAA